MKKVTSILVVVVALLVVMTGMALAGIATTKHNLSSGSSNTIKGDVDQICIYCHTPHSGDNTVAPLWNRSNAEPAGNFTMYTSGTMSQGAGTLASISMACLSCHDGATSINSLLNKGGQSYTGANTVVPAGIARLGTDLQDDHPVGVKMSGSLDGKIYSTPTSTLVRGFGTGDDYVECASCHQVHDNSNPPFLVMSNTNSAICLACHDK